MKRDIDLRGASRRDFIKGVLSASAVLGLGPTRAYEMLEHMGGSALAADACAPATRMVNLVAGNGGLAWFTMVWPAPVAMKTFNASSFAYDDPAKAMALPGLQEGRELYVRKLPNGKPLWDNFGKNKQVTTILAGTGGLHETAPNKAAGNTNVIRDGVGGPVQVSAAAAAIQNKLSALVPVIGLQQKGVNMPYGRAPGSPPLASVPGANEMIGLFSSAASRLADRLADAKGNNPKLFEQYYKAFLGLSKNVSKVTYQRAYNDSKVAVSLVGQNLGSRLAVDQNKLATWCGPAIIDDKVVEMAQGLMVAANAFKLGLTAQVNIPVFNDDPHTAFSNVTRATRIADGVTQVLQSFLDELATTPEPTCSGKSLADSLVFTVSGDLPKNPFTRTDWSDSTPGNSNWIYVMSQGLIKPGWMGDVNPGGKTLIDPSTGQLNPGIGEQPVTNAALAAVLYAVTRGDDRAVRDFYTGEYKGLVNLNLTAV